MQVKAQLNPEYGEMPLFGSKAKTWFEECDEWEYTKALRKNGPAITDALEIAMKAVESLSWLHERVGCIGEPDYAKLHRYYVEQVKQISDEALTRIRSLPLNASQSS